MTNNTSERIAAALERISVSLQALVAINGRAIDDTVEKTIVFRDVLPASGQEIHLNVWNNCLEDKTAACLVSDDPDDEPESDVDPATTISPSCVEYDRYDDQKCAGSESFLRTYYDKDGNFITQKLIPEDRD